MRWPRDEIFIVTEPPEDARADAGLMFANGLDEATARAREAAGSQDVHQGRGGRHPPGGRAGYVEELSISIASDVLDSGSVWFEDFNETVSLDRVRLLQSPFGTRIFYRVVR